MSQYLELPSEDDDVKTEQDIAEESHDPVPQRAYKNYGDCYAYQVHVSLKGNGVGAVTTLLHKEKFTQAELKGKVDAALRVCYETRTLKRREQLAKSQTAVPSSVKLNEEHFENDIIYFEGVMMDKFDFRKLVCETAAGEMTPTILEKW
jgi:hypothetical protein